MRFIDASASTLTFTHESWNYIHGEQNKLYPDKRIVGWQNTHPNYGIFLSNYDIFIQKNFFNLPWQITYVVDPIGDTRGFFQWKSDKVEKINGFYIFDDIGIKINANKIKEDSLKSDITNDDIVKFKVYTIQSDDSLITICKNNNINYYEQKDMILKINGINAENKISSGEKLYLPI